MDTEWIDIVLLAPLPYLQKAQDAATLLAPGGIYTEDYSDLEEGAREIAHIDLIDEELLKKDRETAKVHLYLPASGPVAETLSLLADLLTATPVTITTSTLREEDWANNWRAYYHPIELSERLIVCPEWESCAVKPGQKRLLLDPGVAFGTGTHESTRLCLALLERYLRAGASVLDVGSGSGILAIAAKLLGAGRTAGTDIDPLAVRVAGQNAALNGITDIDFGCLDLAGADRSSYDLVLANIVADTILRLAPSLEGLLAPGGVFICSGIIDTRCAEVEAGLAALGFRLLEKRELGGWCALACAKA